MRTNGWKKLSWLLVAFVCAGLVACGGDNDDDGGSGGDLRTNACGDLGLSSRIINGTECDEANSPVVQIQLLSEAGNGSLCSGSLLTPTKVLTAAHCVVTERIVRAAAGAAGQVSNVTTIQVHPGVRFDNDARAIFNDAAILTLNTPLNLPTLPLLVSRSLQSGDRVSIYGYGLDEDQNLQVLRSGDMRVGSVTPDHVIAGFDGNDGSNTCNGDSGGPLTFRTVDANGNSRVGIVGLTSSGNNPECTAGDISIFANTQNESILNFILAAVPNADTF